MKIVVTGALGHIGSRLIRELPAAFVGAEIVMLDNLSTQRYCSLFELPVSGRYRFVEADIRETELEALFRGATVVVHLAAITDAAGSFEVREQIHEVNLAGTQRVARACAATGSALVFLSTASVYGTQAAVVAEDCPATDLKPQSPYAESKLLAEQYLETSAETEGLPFVICRFGTIFGTSIGMRFHTAINKFCWQAVTSQPLTVWRTALDQRRPYLDLGDAVAALRFILERRQFDRRIYNVLSTNASVRQILELILSHVPSASVCYVDTAIMNQLSYDVANARFTGLGFEFKGNLADGIGQTIGQFRALVGIAPPASQSDPSREHHVYTRGI